MRFVPREGAAAALAHAEGLPRRLLDRDCWGCGYTCGDCKRLYIRTCAKCRSEYCRVDNEGSTETVVGPFSFFFFFATFLLVPLLCVLFLMASMRGGALGCGVCQGV